MNFRNIALVAALVSVAGVASAATFELRAGAGATLVGNTFMVQEGATFDVQVWLNAGTGTYTGNSLIMSLAYDSTSSTSSTADVPRVDGKLFAKPDTAGGNNATSSGQSTGYWTGANSYATASAAFLGAYAGAFTSGMTTARAGAAPTTGNNMSGAGPRPVVWNYGRTGGTGDVTDPDSVGDAGKFVGDVLLATFRFRHTLVAGDTYGDAANENGLYLYNAGPVAGNPTGVAGGSSGISGNTVVNGNPVLTQAPGAFGSSKYAVGVAPVPEPSTMAALGLGLAAIARRRRNKK